MTITYTDIFCGAGGSSIGLTEAGLTLRLAANHWDRAKTTGEPLHTLGTRDSAALVDPAVAVEDCRFRMLKPREHLRAQRFPDSYVVTGNKGEQTTQAGNAVSSNVAHWLGTKALEALS